MINLLLSQLELFDVQLLLEVDLSIGLVITISVSGLH